MPITDKFFVINIRKYLALGDDHEAGEPALIKLLSGFSCPKNPDVERNKEPVGYISSFFKG